MGKRSFLQRYNRLLDVLRIERLGGLILNFVTFRISSLRGRFVVVAIILIALVLPAVIYTKKMVHDASTNSIAVTTSNQTFLSQLSEIKQILQSTESAVFHHTLELDELGRKQVLSLLSQLKDKMFDIEVHEFNKSMPGINSEVSQLQKLLVRIDRELRNLLEILSNVETRYPAAPILLDQLQPTNTLFRSAIEQAITEGNELRSNGSDQQESIVNLFRDIRYAWSQQISSVRVYIANRSGIFGQPEASMPDNAKNREIFANHVSELIIDIKRYDDAGLLGFQQSIAIEKMKLAAVKYEKYFQKAAKIYNSDNWRADATLLNTKIRPLLRRAWSMLYTLEMRVKELAEQNVKMLVDVSGSLSTIILLLMGFVGLTVLLGYLILEYFIRRPIIEVTKAIDAEGRGDSYLPVLSHYAIQETDVLVNAFKLMQNQVHSRQTRLESILNNAGEGIITIDDSGVIETFNTAAQQLFGYTAEEVLGKPSADIIRLVQSRAYGDFLEFCKSPYAKNHMNDAVISTMNKDGTDFSMSITVSEIWVENRQLYIAIVEDISERMALMENLRTMAEHDSLTGLYNREYFMTELDRVVENIKRGMRSDFALLYLDLDNFKFINDTLGHLAGDQVLVEVTSLLSRRIRRSDLLSRIGGDEFAILIYGAGKEKATFAAESYRKLVSNYVLKYDGKVVNLGCSIGVTMFGQAALQKEDLLVQADIACHIAKRSGRNKIHIYDSDDKINMATMSEDMGWVARIKNAIAEDRFFIACQPIINLRTQDVSRYEVLLRMRDDDGSTILPAGFLPSAERFGLMRSIDRWVINNAINLLGNQLKNGRIINLSINLSAKSLEDSTMYDSITEALDMYSVDPRLVMFEITETVAIANMTAALDLLNRLRSLGCKTALDDFGVGYSSFAYLKDLPVDYVKIDGSFVQNMSKDVLQSTMVRSMNDIAHALGKLTVAEYVDSEETYMRLKELGVDFVQGFHTGKPMLFEDIMKLNYREVDLSATVV